MTISAYTPNFPDTTPQSRTLVDRSGTITTGGTAQQAAAANQSRTLLLINNPDPTEDLWFNIGTTAVASQPSIKLAPKGTVMFQPPAVPTGLVSVIAATTSHEFVVKEI